METGLDIPALKYTLCQYGDHRLQRLGIWESAASNDTSDTSSGHWIIFIHGGAWRDPNNTLQDFVPSIKHIVTSEDIPSSAIRAFVSIDYRLSPLTTDPSGAPGARHPDHILDVRSALQFLAASYDLTNNYVLVGHSAGATLAFQLLMGRDALAGHEQPDVPLPNAVIGISGIYDLVGIDARHNGQYTGFITAAFGSDKESWKCASPARYSGSFKANWAGRHLALLAWSPDDTLVDEPEIAAMAEELAGDDVNLRVVKDLIGEHNFVWQDGSQVSRLVSSALSEL